MKNEIFLILQYSTLNSTVVYTAQRLACRGVASSGQAKGVTDCRREEVGDGRAEGSSTIGDGGQAAVSLTCDGDGTGPGSSLDSFLSTPFASGAPGLEIKIP